jgi:hypothetical protein
VGTLEIIFEIVGTVALLVGGGFAVWRAGMLLRWKHRRATVVSYHRQRANRGSSYSRLVVRFADGEEQVEGTDHGPWNRYRVEEEITVLIDPASEIHSVVVPEFLRFWMMTLIFVPFGGVFIYVALAYLPGLPSGH